MVVRPVITIHFVMKRWRAFGQPINTSLPVAVLALGLLPLLGKFPGSGLATSRARRLTARTDQVFQKLLGVIPAKIPPPRLIGRRPIFCFPFGGRTSTVTLCTCIFKQQKNRLMFFLSPHIRRCLSPCPPADSRSTARANSSIYVHRTDRVQTHRITNLFSVHTEAAQ